MIEDNHLNSIEKWFINMEHLPLSIARKLAKIYFEWAKPGHGKYNDWDIEYPVSKK